MKISYFNKVKLITDNIELETDLTLTGILTGEIDIPSLCQEMLTITGSKLAAIILSTAENPFNIVYSTNPGISFCQHMPLLTATDVIVLSNKVDMDPRNIGYNLDKCPIKKLCSIPILRNDTVYGKIILANRPKGYSVNTLATIKKQTMLISSIVISKDENLIFAVSGRKNSEMTFLSSISHEIRTPIHGIVNMINLLSEAGPLNEKQAKYVSCALSSCEDLIETVTDSIDYQKIKNNSLGIQNDSFNLKEMIHKTIELVEFKATQKGLKLHVLFDEKLPEVVYGDKDRIRQVLLNLIGNAIKFTSKGEVVCKVDQYPSRVIFSISDTGCGIKKENLSEVFTEYFQEEKYSKNGMGLGLSLSKKLVQMMGGGISVVSEYGKGTTFTVDLPLSEERYFLDVSSDDDKELSILIVDPLDNNRITLRKFLRQWKIHVDTSSSFKESKKIVEDEKYDVFIINPVANIGEAIIFIHYIEEKYPESRVICVGECDKYNITFDGCIANVNDKQDVYNVVLSVKKRKVKKTALRPIDKVCIVEDDQMSAFALEEILKSKGITGITVIDNGEQAVRNITHNRYDIVFMDCKLAGNMDGIQATKIIKENSVYIKIIGMTASVTEDEKMLWLNSGLDGLIIKPFTAEAIAKVL